MHMHLYVSDKVGVEKVGAAVQATEEQGRLHGSKTFGLLMQRTWQNSGKCRSI